MLPDVSGSVLPICYQFALSDCFTKMLTSDIADYEAWLLANGQNPATPCNVRYYCISNLYIPKIHVEEDRLEINVPRVQFWVSFLPKVGTRELLERRFLGRQFSIGDSVSSVAFRVDGIEDVSPVVYTDFIEYQSLAPIVVKAIRPNKTLEYLTPTNYFFGKFLVEDLIERWERYYQRPYTGYRGFRFDLLCPERRKAVAIFPETAYQQKLVGYMIKFSLQMSPVLQEFAYDAGIGDNIEHGFGYVELLKKKK